MHLAALLRPIQRHAGLLEALAQMLLSEAIKQEALALGFDAVGIARVEPDPSSREKSGTAPAAAVSSPGAVPPPPDPPATVQHLLVHRLTAWLDRGYHATMSWMARSPARRADPTQVLPDCRAIISVALNYYTGHEAAERQGCGRLARYAWGEDYHRVLDERLARLEGRIHTLAPEAQTRRYVDTGPVMEKAWAQEAGVGWIGKHSNLVSGRFGSWLLLGEILTTLPLASDEPGSDLCGSCTLCLQACPTGAIVEPYVVDARRCISYLTIERRVEDGEVPPELAERMGNRIFGCDDCLEICPYNHQATPTQEPAFQPSAHTLHLELANLAQLDPDSFNRVFAMSPVRRSKHSGFQRNVKIALDNAGREAAGAHSKAWVPR